MNLNNAVQYLLFVVVLTLCVRPLGGYMERVFSRRRTMLDPVWAPVERWIYRLTGVDPAAEMTAGQYATCFVIFSLIGTLILYFILRSQRLLPWFFPQYLTTALTPDLSLNTAISFSTTSTWQAYAGENTMSYASQMVGLCVQNFLAGAVGLAVGIAFIRGLAREGFQPLGNFWVDLTRSLLWILAPGSLLGALLLIGQGVPMNFHHYVVAHSLDGPRQVIAQGPVAALEIIKNLGTNGGGFFNANAAHPYENPTALTNILELFAIVLLPAARCTIRARAGSSIGSCSSSSSAVWRRCMSASSAPIRFCTASLPSELRYSRVATWKGKKRGLAWQAPRSPARSPPTPPPVPLTSRTTA
jgi:K+-transporting ATPase ATPase A chain